MIIWLFLSLIPLNQTNPQLIVDQVTIRWEVRELHLVFTINAPTSGWVALGFNTRDQLVGTNLIMGARNGDHEQVEDHFIQYIGHHIRVESLGGTKAIYNYSCEEDQEGTTLTFSIPIQSADSFHHLLQPGNEIWMIIAYSVSDDFDHHSRMRKHVRVRL